MNFPECFDKKLLTAAALVAVHGCAGTATALEADASVAERDAADVTDAAMVTDQGPVDVSSLPYVIQGGIAGHNMYANRTFAVVAYLRQGYRTVFGSRMSLSAVDSSLEVVGRAEMKTICTGNTGSTHVQDNVLLPASAESSIGQVMLSETDCPAHYHDTGMQLGLVHTQPDEPTMRQRASLRLAVTTPVGDLRADVPVQIIPHTMQERERDPLLVETLAPTLLPHAGEDISVVLFPQTRNTVALPCMPVINSTSGESFETVGCTLARNGGREVPSVEVTALNQEQAPVTTAATMLLDPDIRGVQVHARSIGSDGRSPTAITHIGGGAYLVTVRAGLSGDLGSFGVSLRNPDGTFVTETIQMVAIQ